jgi:hypothetical protein
VAVTVNNKKIKGHAPISELFQPTILEFTPKETKSTHRRKSTFKDYITMEENTHI